MNRSKELLAVVAMTVCCFVVRAATAADGASAPIGISQAEMRLRGILQDKADLQFAGEPLKDVLAKIKDKYQVDLQIDDATFNQVKADVAAKVAPDVFQHDVDQAVAAIDAAFGIDSTDG